MGASSYLTRKPWGPASSRSTHRRARASDQRRVSGSIPIDCRRVASAAPSSPERACTSQGFETSAGIGAYTKPERASRMSSRATFATSIFAAFCSLDTDLLNGAPIPIPNSGNVISVRKHLDQSRGQHRRRHCNRAYGEGRRTQEQSPIVLTYATQEAISAERVAVLDGSEGTSQDKSGISGTRSRSFSSNAKQANCQAPRSRLRIRGQSRHARSKVQADSLSALSGTGYRRDGQLSVRIRKGFNRANSRKAMDLP